MVTALILTVLLQRLDEISGIRKLSKAKAVNVFLPLTIYLWDGQDLRSGLFVTLIEPLLWVSLLIMVHRVGGETYSHGVGKFFMLLDPGQRIGIETW